MDAKKFLELQGQIKQNNQEYLEFVSELDSWKADLDKKREKSLQQQRDQKQQQQQNGASENLPPVRNSLMKKKYKKKPKAKSENAEPNAQKKKIAAYDYKAWDKFDVDKACEEIEASPDKASMDEEYETDEEWEEERRKQLAESKKTAGNEAFKAGKFDEAVELYTKATQLNPESAVYYCNRAMALLRLEKFAAAEADCCLALELDSKMVKAYYRRGQARQKLGKLPDALRDLEEALALEPNNKSLQSEVKQLRLNLHPEKYATGELEPVFDKPAAQRSTKPLVRVPIQEVSSLKTAQLAAAATKQVSTSNETKSETKIVSTKSESVAQSAKVVAEKSPSTSNTSSAEPQSEPQPLPPPPETPYQFKTAHRSLARRNPLAFCLHILCAVPPERLPTLIGESLESDTLLDMANAFHAGLTNQPGIAPRVYQCLRLMADRVRRFGTCVAFLSSTEKARLIELMRQLRDCLAQAAAGNDAAFDLKSLAAAYGVPEAVE